MNNKLANNLRKLAATAAILSIGTTGCAAQETAPNQAAFSTLKPNLPSKKLIEYGWDQFYAPNPSYIRDNIREMEKRPFDGIAFCLTDTVAGQENGGRVFDVKGWDEEKLKPQLQVLQDIKWDKFTDNFLMMFAVSNMDWFSDSDWDKVLGHAKFMGLAAKTARCKGIIFDPEPYGTNPWRYDQQVQAKTKSFDEYALKARQRGQQFIKALSAEMPEMKLLMLYQYSLFYTYASKDVDPAKRAQAANKNEYGLMAPFLDGMLEAATSKIEFIDGNEFSYYYKSPLDFYRSYHHLRHEAKLYVAPELRGKFDSNVKASQALYVDYTMNLRPDLHKVSPAVNMSPEARLRYFEHNLYYALQSSDEYVWMYGENVNWYNQKVPQIKEQTPEWIAAVSEAIVSAKDKVSRGEELGFDIATDIKTP
jgi:hypothetical protein